MPQGQDFNKLMRLLQQYGGVSRVPPAMLASAGYTPETAQAVVNQLASQTKIGGPSAVIQHPSILQILGLGKKLGAQNNPATPSQSNAIITGLGSLAVGGGTVASKMPDIFNSDQSTGNWDRSIGIAPTPYNPAIVDQAQQAADQRAAGATRTYGIGNEGYFNPNDAQRGVSDYVAPNWSDYVNQSSQIPYVDIPTPPDPYQFVSHDFTDKATEMAGKAYSPAFAAIDLGKQQAQKDYDYASAITKGLYADQNTQIAANNAALHGTYNDAVAQAKTDVTNENQALSNAYTGSATGVADVLKGLGLGQYAGTVLAPSANEEGFQKGQNQALGTANQNALTQNQLSSDAFGNAVQNAGVVQGTVAQQDLLQGLGQQNSAYEQQRLGLSSDEANRIIDIAQQLTSNDMNLQQANYGSQQNYYNALVNRATSQNSNISNENQLNAQMGQGAYNAAENQYEFMTSQQLEQAKLDLQAQIEQDQVNNNQAQAQIDYAKLVQATQAAQTKATNQGNPAGALDTTVSNILQDQTGQAPSNQQIAAYSQGIQDFALSYNNGVNPTNTNDFVNKAMQYAQANRLDPNAMRYIAWAYLASGMAAGFNNGQNGGSFGGAANLPTAGG